MGKPVIVPKAIQEMAIAILGDRKTQGYTPDDLHDLRDAFRSMATNDIGDFRRYLEAEIVPIRERQKMVFDLVSRIKQSMEKAA